MSAGGWDCHAHLFGPYERYPLAPDRSYTPPEAVESQYLSLLARLGLSNGVLVHPSAYGDDFSLLFDALSRNANLRGVIVVRPGTRATLDGLRDKGIRATRFSHRSGAGANFAGSASFDDLLALAPGLAAAGLHAELWTDCKALPDIAPRLRELPVPVVIDHMGGFDVDAGVDDAGFRCLLSLLESGRVRVKLSAYRNLLGKDDFERGRPFHEAMLQANEDALVWGSDWPHLRVAPAPDAARLLDMLKRWTPDAALLRKLLVSNPHALYG
jgi:predicted TIM-barrel fold metal-dependent hydrolase